MSILFDDEKKELRCSVRDLILEEEVFRIGFSAHEGYERLWVGQSVHAAWRDNQAYARSDYQSEVFLQREFIVEGWTATVQGRADGVFQEDGTTVIEEVKSLHFGRDLSGFFESQAHLLYKKQVEVYAGMWAMGHKGPVEGRLILIDIATREDKTLPVPIDAERVLGFIETRLRILLRGHKKDLEQIRKKAEYAQDMPFPYPRVRPYQKEMMEEVSGAMENRTHVLISAPTGVGKTVAALYPAVRAALSKNLKLFFLTAKTPQQEMAVEVLKKLNPGGGFRSIQLRAKARMCAHTEQLCHENFCPYAKDYAKKLESTQVLDRLLYAFPHLEPDAIFSASRAAEVCPFEVSLELVRCSDVVVCDYNYIFDPSVALKDTREPQALNTTALIIDEAHNLVDRGRGYYSPSILRSRAGIALERAQGLPTAGGARMAAAVSSVLQGLEKLSQDHAGENEKVIEPDLTFSQEALALLESEIVDYFAYIREKDLLTPGDTFLDFYFDLHRFVRVLGMMGKEFAVILRRHAQPEDLEVKIFCLDPSRFIGETLKGTWATVAMSATLAPQWFYKTVLGFPSKETMEATFPSPFPKENRRVLVYPSLDTTYKKRMNRIGELAGLLHALGNAVRGNFLALFPSYHYMKETLALYPHKGKPVIVQEPHHSLKETAELMARMKGSKRNFFLFGVTGGMFAEGVDYPGESLKGVFIVSPALPQVSLEQRLLLEYYEREHEDGFSYAYLIPGMTRVVQAAGRVIRSESDRGVIVLICRRFREKQYTQYFPPDWTEDSVEELVALDPVAEVKKFFAVPPHPKPE